MKKNIYFTALAATLLSLMTLSSCHTQAGLVFADREWHISDHFGQVIDRDTTYRMTFDERLIPVETPLISCADSVDKYPGMERFLADILHTAGLDSAEILFYAPEMLTMFVRTKERDLRQRPSSISSPLQDERPYTMWLYDDDQEDWDRQPSEMYTYTRFNKRKRQLLVVDFYDYGDEPVAQIFIYQSRTKATDKMNVPSYLGLPFLRHDLRDFEKDVEFWASIINGHRRLAFANYKIGQEQKSRIK